MGSVLPEFLQDLRHLHVGGKGRDGLDVRDDQPGIRLPAPVCPAGLGDLVVPCEHLLCIGCRLLHEEPLDKIATELATDEELLQCLHALGDHHDTQHVGDPDDTRAHQTLLRVGCDIRNEETVDLDEVGFGRVEELQPRETGAEVVNGDAVCEPAVRCDHIHRVGQRPELVPLRDLEADGSGRQPMDLEHGGGVLRPVVLGLELAVVQVDEQAGSIGNPGTRELRDRLAPKRSADEGQNTVAVGAVQELLDRREPRPFMISQQALEAEADPRVDVHDRLERVVDEGDTTLPEGQRRQLSGRWSGGSSILACGRCAVLEVVCPKGLRGTAGRPR